MISLGWIVVSNKVLRRTGKPAKFEVVAKALLPSYFYVSGCVPKMRLLHNGCEAGIYPCCPVRN